MFIVGAFPRILHRVHPLGVHHRRSTTAQWGSRFAVPAIAVLLTCFPFLLGPLASGSATEAWAAGSLPPDFELTPVVTGLDQPVRLAFAADGRVFVAERTTGNILVIEDGRLLPEPIATVPVRASGERGLLGIAVTNDRERAYLFAYHSVSPHEHQVTRFTIDERGSTQPRAVDRTTIVDGLPAAAVNNGGAIAVGPDRHLYFTVGDHDRPDDVEADDWAGKLHRLTLDGEIPDDNPWPGSSVYCRGLRNCFSFTFDRVFVDPASPFTARPRTKPTIFLADNGTNIHDEIHRVGPGDDAGWPTVLGPSDDDRFVNPVHAWSPTTAPAGIVLYDGPGFPRAHWRSLFVAEYSTGKIVEIVLDRSGTRAVDRRVFFDGELGPIFALAIAPDGALWFTTGNAVYRIHHRLPPQRFVRGNIDGVNGISFEDSVRLLRYLLDGTAPGCEVAMDVTADERIDVSDVSSLLGFLYGALPANFVIPRPYPECGVDVRSALDCETHPVCE